MNHTVRLPRRTNAASYSGQFGTRYLALEKKLLTTAFGERVRYEFRQPAGRDGRPILRSRRLRATLQASTVGPTARLWAMSAASYNLRSIHAPTRHLGTNLPAAGSLTRPQTARGAFIGSRFLGPAGGKREIGIRLQPRRPGMTGLLIYSNGSNARLFAGITGRHHETCISARFHSPTL
jgi:hypothetical protein